MTETRRHVLFAASECAPLIKTGGLADVAGALPSALNYMGVKTSIILPFYKTLPDEIRKNAIDIDQFTINMGWREQYVGLKKYTEIDRTNYFIDNETYFLRDDLYGYYDDAERFIYFSLAVVASLKYLPSVDVIHCNDWQTALIPTVLKKFHYRDKTLRKIRLVYTIHNLRFQGNLNLEDFISFLGLTGKENWLGEAYNGDQANLLKSALYSADSVTTVSPTYADEIKYAFYGESLEDTINAVSFKLKGILNGIDTEAFNPRDDKNIYLNYNGISGKQQNKKRFLYDYALPDNDSMLIGMVTRLDRQKGLDLVLYALDEIMRLPVQFVMLGTGDGEMENAFRHIEKRYKNRVRSFIQFDEALAHKIYAASDIFLMPSKFEPCGLGQMIAMRYGSLPIVRETGGLADTVMPYNEITGDGTGFSFRNYNGDELLNTVKMAHNVYIYNRPAFSALAARAMEQEFSWTSSAKTYLDLYEQLIQSYTEPIIEPDAPPNKTTQSNDKATKKIKPETPRPSKPAQVVTVQPQEKSDSLKSPAKKTVKGSTPIKTKPVNVTDPDDFFD